MMWQKKTLKKMTQITVASVAMVYFLMPTPAKADTKEFTEAQKIWTTFTACAKQKGEAALEKCFNETLFPELDRLPRQKMEEYILMDFKFSDLHICDERDKVRPLESKKEIYYCLALLGHRSRTQGYATFKKHKNELRLTSIRYDF